MTSSCYKLDSLSSSSVCFDSDVLTPEVTSPRLPSRMSHYSDEESGDFIFYNRKATVHDTKPRRTSYPINNSNEDRRWTCSRTQPYAPASTPTHNQVLSMWTNPPSTAGRRRTAKGDRESQLDVESVPEVLHPPRTGLQGLRQNPKQTYEQILGFGTSGRRSQTCASGVFGRSIQSLTVSSVSSLESDTNSQKNNATRLLNRAQLNRAHRIKRRDSVSESESETSPPSTGPIKASKVVALPSINHNYLLEQHDSDNNTSNYVPDVFLTNKKRSQHRKKEDATRKQKQDQLKQVKRIKDIENKCERFSNKTCMEIPTGIERSVEDGSKYNSGGVWLPQPPSTPVENRGANVRSRRYLQ